MCEVTKSNFDRIFPDFINNLKDATFISIDTEFSGLVSKEEYKPSLFDSPPKRYQKLKNSVQDFLIFQFGISIFKYDRESSGYECFPYYFYLFPRSFGSHDIKFMCQSSSMEFLCYYNFDFNKLFYEGISYINKSKQEQVKKNIFNHNLFNLTERNFSFKVESEIQDCCSQVAQWAAASDSNTNEFIYETKNDFELNYLIQKEVRYRFPGLWTFSSTDDKIIIKKVLESERRLLELESEKDKSLEMKVFDSCVGFTKIIDEIIKHKKPLVAHNMLLDLILTYKQFIGPLPNCYYKFKKAINELFPTVYDTKHISFELKSKIKKNEVWPGNSLSELYNYFDSGRGSTLCIYSPSVKTPRDNFQTDKFHDAGYDAYCTGVCFLKMAHCLTMWDSNKNMFVSRPLKPLFREYLTPLEPFVNRVNIIRATRNHLNLSGPDPPSTRPPLIFVKTKGFKTLNILQITESFAKFGNVDVMPYSRQKALVAVGNHMCAKDILKHFYNHNSYHVCQYSFFKHSTTAQTLFWTSLLVSSTFCIIYCWKNINNNK